MLYNNDKELLEILKKNNLYAKKKLGQNFLVNTHYIDSIIKSSELNSSDNVIEIGPGIGILTGELLKNSAHLTSLELDSDLIPHLSSTFSQHKNFELLNADALKFELPTTPYKLIANIPYYITSPILNHFLNPKPDTNQLKPNLITILVQNGITIK